MILTKYKPKNSFPSLLDDFMKSDLFFDDFMIKNSRSPTYDVIENESQYTIEMHLSGYKKKDLKLDVEDGMLIVSGERKEKEDTKYNFKGSSYGSFKNSFTLPKDVSVDKIDAEYVDGVLNITIPKDQEKIKSKLIEIK